MKKSSKKKELSSPLLKTFEKDLARIERSEDYLNKEKAKLIIQKEKVKKKIAKEKEIIRLKNRINHLRGR